MKLMDGLKVIASERRLRVLQLLGSRKLLGEDYLEFEGRGGATATGLIRHLGITQASLSEQMQLLLNAGLVEAHRYGRNVFYTRDEERIRQLKQTIIDQLLPPAG